MRPLRKPVKKITLTFFRNGYIWGDEPLRGFEDPASQNFLTEISNGILPRAIADQHPNTEIDVEFVDRRDEEFVKPAYVPFGGEGRRVAPIRSADDASAPGATCPPSSAAEHQFHVNEEEQKCSIAIVDFAGERHEHVVNPTVHTVRDVRFLAASRFTPPLGLDNFDLAVRDIPPRPLRDDSKTIDAVNCRNATIMMKKKT
jgi:hypothetical protein